MAVLTCSVSALCRQSFSSLVRSLLVYIGPYAFLRLVLDALPVGRVNALLHYLCYSAPISYPGTFSEAPGNARLLLTAMALAVPLSAAALGAYRYCNHQVR